MKFVKDKDTEFQLEQFFNKGIELADNVRGALLEYTSSGATDELEHNLGYIPVGWWVIFRAGEIDVWTTENQLALWTSNKIYLQSNVPNVLVRLFVM